MTGSARPPVLLTSLTAAALLDGRGDLALTRETRGAVVEWGGVFAQLVRLTGAWRVSVRADGSSYDLPSTCVRSSSEGNVFRSVHRSEHWELEQEVAALPRPPGVLRRLRITSSGVRDPTVVLRSRWSPYLLPVLVEGIRPRLFQARLREGAIEVRQHEFALELRASLASSGPTLNGDPWSGEAWDGPIDELSTDYAIAANGAGPKELLLLLHGGLHRELESRQVAEAALGDPAPALASAGAADRAWEATTPELSFPDAPWLERGYRQARAALRRLYTAPGGGLYGLVAGYPWYSAIWCRDLAWMLPAVLWMGDHDWVERSLRSVFRFQSHADVPILGGTRGELPMQIAPGPIFLFGTSDTTLYYPMLVERLGLHSGRPSSSWTGAVGRILEWGEARTDPATGLFRHGGEARSVGSVTTRLARVRYGIEANDTTIWDSTDRRDHAIELQLLWHEALEVAVRLLSKGADPRCPRWQQAADRLRETVLQRYRWAEERYLFDSLNSDGPVAKLRPNALRAVSEGWLDPSTSRALVDRASKPDLTTPWGVRTLSSKSPGYDPQAYHDGQVWSIATAWAAEAAFAAGEPDRGLGYLCTLSQRMEEEGGWANECYRGDRAEPFDSCFLLGFSIAPFLTVLFERLWGLRLEAAVPRLNVRPCFPAGWRSARIERLRLGESLVDLAWSPSQLSIRWSGTRPLEMETAAGETTVPAGARETIALPPHP